MGLKNTYLAAYNLGCAAGWAYVLVILAKHQVMRILLVTTAALLRSQADETVLYCSCMFRLRGPAMKLLGKSWQRRYWPCKQLQ
jgi:hypothetical protein